MTLPTQPQKNRAVEPAHANARRGAFEQPIGYLADSYLALKARRWRPLTCEVNRSHVLRFCEWLEERDVRDQCLAAGVSFFHKQHGGARRIGGVFGGRELDGRTWEEFPKEANHHV